MPKCPTCNQRSSRGRGDKANCILLKEENEPWGRILEGEIVLLEKGKVSRGRTAAEESVLSLEKKDNVDRKNTKNEFKGE